MYCHSLPTPAKSINLGNRLGFLSAEELPSLVLKWMPCFLRSRKWENFWSAPSVGEPRGDWGISRLGLVGSVRLRIAVRWLMYGEDGAERALLAGVVAWGGDLKEVPLGRVGSSSADAAVGPFLVRAPRVSVNERMKCRPAYATIVGLVRSIIPILWGLRSIRSVKGRYNRMFGQTLTSDFSCVGWSSSTKCSSSLLP